MTTNHIKMEVDPASETSWAMSNAIFVTMNQLLSQTESHMFFYLASLHNQLQKTPVLKQTSVGLQVSNC
jgi:hypothetical protein